MEMLISCISKQINNMKKFILMAFTALFALSASAQKTEEVKKAPPKVVKVEKAKEVKPPPQKAKFKGKTPPKVVMKKFVPPPPPPVVKEETIKPPPPPPIEKRPVKKSNKKQPPKAEVINEKANRN
jgi:hypothetical protein